MVNVSGSPGRCFRSMDRCRTATKGPARGLSACPATDQVVIAVPRAAEMGEGLLLWWLAAYRRSRGEIGSGRRGGVLA